VTTKWFDQIIAALITAVIVYFGSMLAFFGFYSILIAIGAGFVAVWAVKKAINNRRSPLLKYVMSGTALIVSLIPTVVEILQQISYYGSLLDLYSIIWKLAYAVIVSGYIFYRLKN